MADVPEYQKAKYLKSAVDLEGLPPEDGAEVAFIGRSNSGKSSSLNVLTNIKGLARTSKTPGRTQMINLFELDSKRRLVDLPGYGYAKVPLSVKQRWTENVDDYLRTRQCLKGLVVLMDIRHPLKELDWQVIKWAVDCGTPLHILLTKADKLKSGAGRKALRDVQNELADYASFLSLQLFSSIDRTGVDELKTVLNEWFE